MVKKTSGERMAAIETDISNIKESIVTHVSEQREDFNTLFKKLDVLGTKFAGKWVEKVTSGILITLVAGIIIVIITGGI